MVANDSIGSRSNELMTFAHTKHDREMTTKGSVGNQRLPQDYCPSRKAREEHM